MIKNSIEVSVCASNGNKIKEYDFNDFKFIEAQEGSEFIIKVKNPTSRRALANISIDGRCAISGGEAKDSQEGYIINAFDTISIKGFRLSDDDIASFKFSSGDKSYATYLEKTENKISEGETAKNNGVIGIRITLEKAAPIPEVIFKDRIIYRDRTPWVWPNYNYPYYNQPYSVTWANSQGDSGEYRGFYGNSSMNCSYSTSSNVVQSNADNSMPKSANLNNVLRSAAAFDLGTTFGEKKNDRVTHVSFERSSEVFTMEIHYASRKALELMGVDLNPKKAISIPSAFREKKYCLVPEGW